MAAAFEPISPLNLRSRTALLQSGLHIPSRKGLLVQGLLSSSTWTWVVIPLLIFCARIVDVTVGTARVVFVSRGYRLLAACAGFVEVLIWLLAIGQIMKNLSNPMCYIAYASGFALGNYIGITLTERMSLGIVLIRVIVNRSAEPLIEALRQREYGVTCIEGEGVFGRVNIVFSIIPRREVNEAVGVIKRFNPKAFYSIEDVARVSENKFIAPRSILGMGPFNLFRPFRKGK